MIKFCKNCKYYKTPPFYTQPILNECTNPKISKETSTITGKTYPYEKSCWYLRKVYGECGVNGKLFEPKEHTSMFSWLWKALLLCE